MRFQAALNALTRIDNSQHTSSTAERDVSSASVAEKLLVEASAVIVGYGRQSSKDKNTSRERQYEDENAFAVSLFGRGLDGFYFDKKSGRLEKLRPEFVRLKQDVTDGKVQIVIIEQPDRVARSAAIMTNFKRLCDSKGVKIYTVQKRSELQGLDAAISSQMSEEQAIAIADRCRKGRVKAAETKMMDMPFGYIKINNVWHIDPVRRKIIEYAFSAARAGMNLSMIARIINARFAMERDNTAPHVDGVTVENWLSNLKYIGIGTFGKTHRKLDLFNEVYEYEKVPESEWKYYIDPKYAIIDRETFYAVAKIYSKDRLPKKLSRPHMLVPSTLPVCASCGTGMRSYKRFRRHKPRYFDLRCPDRDCVENMGFDLEEVENHVLDVVRSILEDPKYEADFVGQLQGELGRMKDQLASDRAGLMKDKKRLNENLQLLMGAVTRKILKEKAEREDRLAGIERAADPDDDDDLLSGFSASQIKQQIADRTSELNAVEIKLGSLRPEPAQIDPDGRSRVLAAFERVIESRRDSGPVLTPKAGLVMDSEAAIASVFEVIRMGAVRPGRARRYELVVRLDAIFGDAIAQFHEPRLTFVRVSHPSRVMMLPVVRDTTHSVDIYRSGLYASTDEEFAAVQHAISADIKKRARRFLPTVREFVDILFFLARTSECGDYLRGLMADNGLGLFAVVRSAIRDGTWEAVFNVVKERFPELFQLMNTTGLPKAIQRRTDTTRQHAALRRTGHGPHRPSARVIKREKKLGRRRSASTST